MTDTPVTEMVPTCRVVRRGPNTNAKQQLLHAAGISADTVGAKGIHMQLVTIPPLARAKAHKHEGHETAIYMLNGKSGVWFGEELEQHLFVSAGEFFYIPANMPHLPYNPSEEEVCVAVVARTDPHDEESVVLLNDLDALFPDPVGAYKLPRTNPEASGER
jgi:uncharacterized RmlC-like cupin family protein